MAVKPMSMEREYAKNPDISPQDIKTFREWLMTQPHLPGNLITDLELMLTYHCCERSLAASKKVLDLHYTMRTLYPYFKDRVVDNKTEICLNTILFSVLAEPHVDGFKVVYIRLLDSDPRNFVFADAIRTFMMMYDLWQWEEGTNSGVVIILNLDSVQLSHLTKVEISALKTVLHFVQECMIVKLKAVHFMNAPYFMDKVMMLMRPFLKKTLLEIMHIHPVGDKTLYDCVPKKAFPKEGGGEYLDHKRIKEELLHRLKSNSEFFKEEIKKRVQESLRPGGKSAAADNFGIQGSFKKLDID